MQAPRCIDDDDIIRARLGGGNRIVDYRRRIGAGFLLDDFDADALRPDSSCSTAAARNVSAAQSTTLCPSWRSLFASFPMLVVFPAPLTPTMKITRGPLPFCEVEMPLPAARSGLTGAFRIRMMCDLISRLSCAASASA